MNYSPLKETITFTFVSTCAIEREKGGDLAQSHEKNL